MTFFEQDYIQLVIAIILCLSALIGFKELYNLEKNILNKKVFSILLFGIGLLLFALIGNSINEKRWDTQYIFAFLTFKKAGDWFFRFLLPFAYLLIILGSELVFIIFLRRKHLK